MSNKKIEINLPVADDIDIDFSNYPTKAQQLKLQDTLQGIEEKLKAKPHKKDLSRIAENVI